MRRPLAAVAAATLTGSLLAAPPAEAASCATTANYNKITVGQTYGKAMSTMGSTGRKVASSSGQKSDGTWYTDSAYAWQKCSDTVVRFTVIIRSSSGGRVTAVVKKYTS